MRSSKYVSERRRLIGLTTTAAKTSLMWC